MLRIQFLTDQDRVKANYLLATKSVVRRLRGQIFEIAEHDRKLLDEHELHYKVLSIPEILQRNLEGPVSSDRYLDHVPRD